MSRVRARRSPITGSLVVADVVLVGDSDPAVGKVDELKQEILNICREKLSRHKVPIAINFVASLAIAESGKIERRDG